MLPNNVNSVVLVKYKKRGNISIKALKKNNKKEKKKKKRKREQSPEGALPINECVRHI